MDEVTLTLSSPMTEEQWDMIADYDFNHTNEITFHTKHGKTVRFVKESAQPQYEELTPEEAASEIASGSIMSTWYWLDDMVRLKQMGYAICRKR